MSALARSSFKETGENHLGFTNNHLFITFVNYLGGEDDSAFRRIPIAHLYPGRQSFADSCRRPKRKLLTRVHATGPGQYRAQSAGNQRRNEHPVNDPTSESRLSSVIFVKVYWVSIAGQFTKSLNVLLSKGPGECGFFAYSETRARAWNRVHCVSQN